MSSQFSALKILRAAEKKSGKKKNLQGAHLQCHKGRVLGVRSFAFLLSCFLLLDQFSNSGQQLEQQGHHQPNP